MKLKCLLVKKRTGEKELSSSGFTTEFNALILQNLFISEPKIQMEKKLCNYKGMEDGSFSSCVKGGHVGIQVFK